MQETVRLLDSSVDQLGNISTRNLLEDKLAADVNKARAAASIGSSWQWKRKAEEATCDFCKRSPRNQSADSERVVRTRILLPVVSWTLRGDHPVQVPGRITMHEMRGDRLHHPDPAVICLETINQSNGYSIFVVFSSLVGSCLRLNLQVEAGIDYSLCRV